MSKLSFSNSIPAEKSSPQMDCIIYYGTEIPSPKKTLPLENTHIILQDYHPLVQEGMFKAFFPNCVRYLYWNPSRIPIAQFEKLPDQPPILGIDQTWGTVYLDLGQERGMAFALRNALALLTPERGAHGLFVDNADDWCGSLQAIRTLKSLLDSVYAGNAYFETKFSLNRGFPLWHNTKGIASVILEDFDLDSLLHEDEQSFLWHKKIHDIYISLIGIQNPEIPLFCLSYSNNKNANAFNNSYTKERLLTYQSMKSLVKREIFCHPQLNQWPASFVE